MMRKLARLLRDRSGATAIEYGLIVALIVIVIVASISVVGGRTGGIWNNMTAKVAAVEPS